MTHPFFHRPFTRAVKVGSDATWAVTRLAVRSSLVVPRLAAGTLGRRLMPEVPADTVPAGRTVRLPGRGSTFVVDVPGPTPDAPVVVLLHGLACTAYLNWFPVLGALGDRYRVVAFDQRWHGRGIASERFRIEDCADDAVAVLDALGIDRAVLAGYSLGGFVAQETWHRHPDRVAGLVLASTARNGQGTVHERLFFPVLAATMNPVSRHAAARVEQLAQSLPLTPDVHLTDLPSWGLAQVRSTSGWAYPEVVNAVGHFDSSPWIGDVDVPTAVVVTEKDHAIPTRRQHKLAAAVPGARVFSAPGGHASVVLDAARWLPVFEDALDDVWRRAGADVAGSTHRLRDVSAG